MKISQPVRRIAMLCTALTMFATPTIAQGPGWTAASTVTYLVNTANGGVNVYLNPLLTGCASQSGYGEHYASIYPDHPSINRIKADLSLALATGKRIQLYLGDNTCRVLETLLYAE